MIERLVVDLADWLPFGYAFGVGMVTAVSPCGVAMLPAYVSLYLGIREEGYWSRSALWRCGRAVGMSLVVTLGFVALFGVMGAIISLGGQLIMDFIPWVAVLIGVALVLLGAYLAFGGQVHTNLPARLASRLSRGGDVGLRGFLVFGVAYGVAALSCTLPVFMIVVAGALSAGWWLPGALQFVLFALGMGFIVAVVAVASALFRETVDRWLRRLVPVVARLSGLLLLFAGGYILYFWFVVGDILG
jgi:cytochrome c biogenesis protein CcdA